MPSELSYACSKNGIQVQYVRDPSSGQWTLTTSRRGIWTSNLKIQILTCVFQFCTSICFDRGSTSIPWSKFRKARFHYLPQLGNFKFVDCWILKFVRTMRFLFPHFIIKLAPTWKWPIKTKIDDFDLKYPQRQGMVWKLQVHWNAPRGNKELIE